MFKKLNRKNIGWTMLIVFLAMQVFSIDKTNPTTDEKVDFLSTVDVPNDVKMLLENACMDCHSHNTTYPWYTNIEPVSWLVKGHIKEGRKHLNFSTWQTYDSPRKSHKIDECIEVIEEKWMPMASYTWMHSEAKLTDDNRSRLIAFFESLRR